MMAGAIATTTSILGCTSTCRSIPTPPFTSRHPLHLHQIRLRLQFQSFPSLVRTRNPVVKASVGSVDYVAEPATDVKFQSEINLPGCSGPLAFFGAGYREKVFAIIGVKVYAAGFYVTNSVNSLLGAWKGKSASQIEEDQTIFTSLYESNSEKSLQIVLVRDVDGKTFWDALDEAISPRIKQPTSIDETALSLFRNTFQNRPLKKGTFIFLTWVNPSKMLVCISSDGFPASVDATIDSPNVASALFDVFLGAAPVSPTLKASVANGLAMLLK